MAFASASEPLRVANHLAGAPLYRWFLISTDGQPVTSSNGMTSAVQHGLADAPTVDRVIVCASFEPRRAVTPALRAWLRRAAAAGVSIGGIDTGSEVLARCGLLAGYRATIHWEWLDAFRGAYPETTVTQDVFITDRRRFSAAGGTACLDLMLNFIRDQHGHTLAAAVSDQFVYNRIRQHGDAQRMALEDRLPVRSRRLARAIGAMEGHIDEPLSIPALAAHAGVSVRELERLLQRWLKTTPGAYYRRLRLERARSLLALSANSISEIALACGFGSPAGFSRAYRVCFGESPRAARHRTLGLGAGNADNKQTEPV